MTSVPKESWPSDLEKQRNFFDKEEHLYSQEFVKKPPLHTQLETSRLLEGLKNVDKRTLVVEFGCGSGRITIPLLQQNFTVLAIDISKKSLEALEQLTKTLSLKGLRTATVLPKNRKYNVIVGADILHHIELDLYLPRLYKALEKGGKLIFSEPGALNPSWYIYLPLFYDWGVEKGIMQCTYFNLKNKLKVCGFRKITITGLGLFPRPFFNWSKTLCKLNDSLGNLPLIKLFAYRYIVEASK